MTTSPLDDLRTKATVTIPEAAKILSISTATAYRWANEGTLPGAFRAGPGAIRVRTADLLALFEPNQGRERQVDTPHPELMEHINLSEEKS